MPVEAIGLQGMPVTVPPMELDGEAVFPHEGDDVFVMMGDGTLVPSHTSRFHFAQPAHGRQRDLLDSVHLGMAEIALETARAHRFGSVGDLREAVLGALKKPDTLPPANGTSQEPLPIGPTADSHIGRLAARTANGDKTAGRELIEYVTDLPGQLLTREDVIQIVAAAPKSAWASAALRVVVEHDRADLFVQEDVSVLEEAALKFSEARWAFLSLLAARKDLTSQRAGQSLQPYVEQFRIRQSRWPFAIW